MLPRRIAGRYADALFGLAQEQGKISEIRQDIASVAEVMSTMPDFREILTHPEIPLQQKEAVVNKVFQGKISPEVLAVMFMLIKRGHDVDLATIHDIYVEQWNKARRVLPVTVESAIPLNTNQVAALQQALTKRTGATITIQQAVDPGLIAGMVVTIGDRVIDASARTALAQLREVMTGA